MGIQHKESLKNHQSPSGVLGQILEERGSGSHQWGNSNKGESVVSREASVPVRKMDHIWRHELNRKKALGHVRALGLRSAHYLKLLYGKPWFNRYSLARAASSFSVSSAPPAEFPPEEDSCDFPLWFRMAPWETLPAQVSLPGVARPTPQTSSATLPMLGQSPHVPLATKDSSEGSLSGGFSKLLTPVLCLNSFPGLWLWPCL